MNNNRPQQLAIKDLNSIKMLTNPPQSVIRSGYRVIFRGMVRRYVGIGWVEEGKATENDYNQIPEVL